MSKICRHCQRKPINRPRGLCCGCYYTPGVRRLYPSTSKYVKHNSGFRAIGLPKPTSIPPGPDKVQVLFERASSNLLLWHPDDAPVDIK